jgi:hypothetical protein
LQVGDEKKSTPVPLVLLLNAEGDDCLEAFPTRSIELKELKGPGSIF